MQHTAKASSAQSSGTRCMTATRPDRVLNACTACSVPGITSQNSASDRGRCSTRAASNGPVSYTHLTLPTTIRV